MGGRRWGLTGPRGVVPAAQVGREVRPGRSSSTVGAGDRTRGGSVARRRSSEADLTVGAFASVPMVGPAVRPFLS